MDQKFDLTVVGDFASYRRGDLITNQAAIDTIMATEQRNHVRKVARAAASPTAATPSVAAATPTTPASETVPSGTSGSVPAAGS